MTVEHNDGNEIQVKKRSLTSLTLGWLAERMRKVETIKAQLSSGAYQVESDKIAQSIVNTK